MTEDGDDDEDEPLQKKGFLELAQEKLALMEKREDQGLVEHAIKDPKYKQKMKAIADINDQPEIANAAEKEGEDAVYQALME